jgi:hypothetical protein
MTFSQEVINFASGETEKTFSIAIPETSQGSTGSFKAEVSGTNAASFPVGDTVYPYDISAIDNVVPIVLELKTTNINRTSVSATCKTNEPVTVYYMIGLVGTPAPTLEEMKSGQLDSSRGASLSWTPVFGVTTDETEESDGSYTYRFSIKSLTA